MTILVTRPTPEGEALTEALTKAGYSARHFPTLWITAIAKDFTETQSRLRESDWVIFISKNAVRYGAQYCKALVLSTIAVGKGTRDAMEHESLSAPRLPAEYNSEGILAMPQLEHVDGQIISIVKGVGGREFLGETLRERGATVHEIEVYARDCPALDPSQYLTAAEVKNIDRLVLTSVAAANNLIRLTEKNAHRDLFAKPALIMGRRMVHYVNALGYHGPLTLLQEGSIEEIIEQLRQEKYESTNA